MFGSIMLMLVLLASPSFASREYPQGYWEKTYNTGDIPAATYSVTVQVKDTGKAMNEVDRRITKAGGSLLSMNNSGSFDSTGRQMRSLSYSLDAKSAEALAKSFFDLGELQSYSTQRNRGAKEADEIRDKLKDLQGERDANSEALLKMPISVNYLNGHITLLKQALAAIESGTTKATLQLTLIEQSLKVKK